MLFVSRINARNCCSFVGCGKGRWIWLSLLAFPIRDTHTYIYTHTRGSKTWFWFTKRAHEDWRTRIVYAKRLNSDDVVLLCSRRKVLAAPPPPSFSRLRAPHPPQLYTLLNWRKRNGLRHRIRARAHSRHPSVVQSVRILLDAHAGRERMRAWLFRTRYVCVYVRRLHNVRSN